MVGKVRADWSIAYRHVQNDNGGDESNTGTANDTAGAHKTEASRSSLENATNDKNHTARDDGGSTSNEVGDIPGNDGAEKGTTGQNGGSQRLVTRRQVESGLEVRVVGGVFVRVRDASVLTDKVWHCQDTTHPAGIITKEDTAKGSKGTDQVGSYGDRGLEARRVRRPRNDNGCYSSSRHNGGDVD